MLFYSVFMVPAACLPVLRAEWDITATQAGTVAAGFSFGYAASLLVFSWLADRIGAKRVFLISAVLSVLSALAFGLFSRSYMSGLVFYTMAALTQGGLYTPAIMLFADRYAPAQRGTAVGWLIASNTIGYSFSVLMAGAMLALGGYETAFIVAGVLPISGFVVCALALRDTENVIRPRPTAGGAGRILRTNPTARRLVAGYTFHTWELLTMWAWLPAFLAAGLGLAGADLGKATQTSAYLTAIIYLTGSFASWSMGALSDRLGRRRLLLSLATTSAIFSMSFGWMVAWPTLALLIIGLAYTFVAVGDSPVLSAALTEAVDAADLGSVLAVRALFGFTAGAIGPIAFGAIIDATNDPGTTPDTWGWAFMAVAAGGVGAAWSAHRLGR
jgi:MFS family permease